MALKITVYLFELIADYILVFIYGLAPSMQLLPLERAYKFV